MPTFGTPVYAGRQSSNDGALIVPTPGDLADGDILIVALRSQDATHSPWVAPEGFVLITADQDLASPGTRVGAIFVKTIVSVAEMPTEYLFTGPLSRAVAISVACTPDSADRADPVVRVGNARYGGIPEAGGFNSIAEHDLLSEPALSLVAVGSEQTEGNSMVPVVTPSGFTEVGITQSSLDDSTTGSRTAIWLGYRVETDLHIERLETQYTNGSAVGMYLGAFTGGDTTAVAPVEPIPGFRSVAQMLSTPGATWAHRGGSAWPEMSERAYRHAVLEGYGALEFSCARSSDGVWFGLHDTTLNRTSETTGLPDVSTMTWAEILTHPNSLKSDGVPETYMKLTDFMDTYASTHVVIVDIKYGWSFAQEWFTLLGGYTNDRQRIIVKYFGPTSFSAEMRDYAQSAGFSSWGYYYPDNVTSGELEATQDHWSILGMDYGADQASWDAILAYGKPVAGHIAPSVDAYNMAITKGAHMVQCSGVDAIPAVGAPISTQAWDAIYAQGSRIPASALYSGTTKVWP